MNLIETFSQWKRENHQSSPTFIKTYLVQLDDKMNNLKTFHRTRYTYFYIYF